jgi:hypothetical protein
MELGLHPSRFSLLQAAFHAVDGLDWAGVGAMDRVIGFTLTVTERKMVLLELGNIFDNAIAIWNEFWTRVNNIRQEEGLVPLEIPTKPVSFVNSLFSHAC